MRIVRFRHNSREAWGVLKGSRVFALKGHHFERIELSRPSFSLDKVKLLPPAVPSKIILVGLNYRDHAKELNMPIPKEPIIFLKPNTSLLAHKESIIYPKGVQRLDYEAELAFVIKKEGKNISPKNAGDYILGYTCLNDVTARDLQKKDIQWTRSKSFDTFCPLGPWIETEINPRKLKVSSYLNGKLKQDSSTANFIFSVPFLISFISKIMTLFPGDVISTGTPPNVGPMQPGDTIEIEIEGIGRLVNKVKEG